ncbi:MFS transporter [Streptomyces aculeolatus]
MTTPGKLPIVVWVLAAGAFLMGTTEFVIAGLLPDMAADLGVSVSHTGLMITIFAVGVIIGWPVMALALAALRLPQRHTIVGSLAVFALGHIILAASSFFTVILIARFVTALATGAFYAVGFVIATAAAGPGKKATRAVGMIMGRLTLSNVLGVPNGSFAGQAIGWRGPFWALAALSAVAAALALFLLLPLSTSAVAAIVLSFLMALTGFTLNPIVTSLAVRFAGDAPTLTTSAYETGVAAGSALAGVALDSALGLTGPALVGAIFAVLPLAPLIMLAVCDTSTRLRVVAQRAPADAGAAAPAARH